VHEFRIKKSRRNILGTMMKEKKDREMSNSPRIDQEPETVANYCMFNVNDKYK